MAISDLILSGIGGQVDPRDKIAAAMAYTRNPADPMVQAAWRKASGQPDAPAPVNAAAGGQNLPGGLPNSVPTAAPEAGKPGVPAGQQPPPPPPQPQAYTSPPDMVQLYTEVMKRGEADASIDRGVGLLMGAFAQPANRQRIYEAGNAQADADIAAFGGAPGGGGGGKGGAGGLGAGVPGFLGTAMNLSSQMQSMQEDRDLRAQLPAIQQQTGLPMEQILEYYNSGKLPEMLQQMRKEKLDRDQLAAQEKDLPALAAQEHLTIEQERAKLANQGVLGSGVAAAQTRADTIEKQNEQMTHVDEWAKLTGTSPSIIAAHIQQGDIQTFLENNKDRIQTLADQSATNTDKAALHAISDKLAAAADLDRQTVDAMIDKNQWPDFIQAHPDIAQKVQDRAVSLADKQDLLKQSAQLADQYRISEALVRSKINDGSWGAFVQQEINRPQQLQDRDYVLAHAGELGKPYGLSEDESQILARDNKLAAYIQANPNQKQELEQRAQQMLHKDEYARQEGVSPDVIQAQIDNKTLAANLQTNIDRPRQLADLAADEKNYPNIAEQTQTPLSDVIQMAHDKKLGEFLSKFYEPTPIGKLWNQYRVEQIKQGKPFVDINTFREKSGLDAAGAGKFGLNMVTDENNYGYQLNSTGGATPIMDPMNPGQRLKFPKPIQYLDVKTGFVPKDPRTGQTRGEPVPIENEPAAAAAAKGGEQGKTAAEMALADYNRQRGVDIIDSILGAPERGIPEDKGADFTGTSGNRSAFEPGFMANLMGWSGTNRVQRAIDQLNALNMASQYQTLRGTGPVATAEGRVVAALGDLQDPSKLTPLELKNAFKIVRQGLIDVGVAYHKTAGDTSGQSGINTTQPPTSAQAAKPAEGSTVYDAQGNPYIVTKGKPVKIEKPKGQ